MESKSSSNTMVNTIKGSDVKMTPYKTVITEELSAELCGYVREGMPFGHAYILAGVPEDTGRHWRANRTNPECVELTKRMNKARSDFYKSMVKCVVNKAPEEWVASMTVLERRDPRNWGRNNYKYEYDLKGSVDEQFSKIAEGLKENNLSLNEAEVLLRLIATKSKIDEVENLKKELEELKTLVMDKISS